MFVRKSTVFVKVTDGSPAKTHAQPIHEARAVGNIEKKSMLQWQQFKKKKHKNLSTLYFFYIKIFVNHYLPDAMKFDPIFIDCNQN